MRLESHMAVPHRIAAIPLSHPFPFDLSTP